VKCLSTFSFAFLFALLAAMSVASESSATAHYEARASGRLDFKSVGTQSIFEGNGSVSFGVPGFTITVDDRFEIPVLQEWYVHETDGFGHFYSAGSSSAQLISVSDPYNVGVGESLSIHVGATGKATDTTRSSASSSAEIHAMLYLVNNSEHEVVVDGLWHYSATRNALYSGPDGELAFASVDLQPFIGDLGTSPITYRVNPNTTEKIMFLAAAEGHAFTPRGVPQPEPVPEPASLLIWLVMGLSVLIVLFYNKCVERFLH